MEEGPEPMVTTDAWVIRRGPTAPKGLYREVFPLPDMGAHDVLVEPVYGSWEANLTHAIDRFPVDICLQRDEARVVLGNVGIIRVVQTGAAVHSLRPGQHGFLLPAGVLDDFGFVKLVHAYDAPDTIGLLARRVVLPSRLVHPVPDGSPYSLRQWASYGRYWTAWDNWGVTYRCWRSQMGSCDLAKPLAVAWGGGVALAELELARRAGFQAVMIASRPERLERIRRAGFIPLDRREFPDLAYDAVRMSQDRAYRSRYRQSERTFLAKIEEISDGYGASIMIDNIGTHVARASVAALGRQGVFTTVGWKSGMKQETVRARECINRHIYVHTHVARWGVQRKVIDYQLRTGFIADMAEEPVYGWEEIPDLARDYAAGRIAGYFPLFQVNKET
jgi:NADPH:quinone reductase-like Zn-dependent oxidoreductase